ncbi:hypothetical protein RHSIM_Rhsim13G0051000 [Rhododendron simsii]|uniref:DUF506 family protein n=1 Tax=Rhododendron simsii TaxID=118357 RepID=A0A834FYA0_RHOSS|nr:hypothetical protein RHSIM_Rhsim13G0051000 [Rhododendron simsii]
MAGFARAKRVTDPLNDRVKALIVGQAGREPVYASSGSEHGGEEYSPCLSELIHGFLEDDAGGGGGGRGGESPDCESDSERDPSMCDQTDVIGDLVNVSITMNADSFRNSLSAHVSNAATAFKFSSVKPSRSVLRRAVMASLRELGYNAAICKTKWERSGGLTAGNYEFIDVVVQPDPATSQSHRYFIDLDFVAEFEIARPTDRYERLLEKLPGVFIGRGEELKEIVKVMSDAAKRSLKSRGLSLPPWRKNRFMQNKWFGPYRRTVNAIPANSPSVLTGFAVKCRSVGFDAVNGRLFFPATTRTR